MENLSAPWSLPRLATGEVAYPLPAPGTPLPPAPDLAVVTSGTTTLQEWATGRHWRL